MKKLFIVLLAISILLAFACNSSMSADKPVDKSKQAPARIDKAKADSSEKSIQSKDVKGKTKKNASTKSDKALGSGVGPIPPGPPSPGPIGKSTNSVK